MMPVIETKGLYSWDEVSKALEENGYFEIKNPTVITNDGRKMEVKGTFRIYKHR